MQLKLDFRLRVREQRGILKDSSEKEKETVNEAS